MYRSLKTDVKKSGVLLCSMPFDDGGNSKSAVSPEPNFLSETRVWVGSLIFCLTVAAIIIIVVLLCFASF